MPTSADLERLASLTPDDLVSAYSGRRGCACGCRGKHSYVDAEEGGRRRGYPVQPDEVSRVRCANVLRTIQRAAREAADVELIASSLDDGPIWTLETETRLYIAYVR